MGNSERFTGRVAVYERYRQRYDGDAILPLLQQWCGLQPNWTIADIGAGTGMLSEVFLANGNPVIAIEPNAEMLAACARLASQWPKLTLVDAAAEATNLADASVDMVTAGRAFHWFDAPKALAEFRRILKPNGWLALISLGREKDTSPQCASFETLLTTHGTDHSYVRSGYRVHDNLSEIYPGLLYQEKIHWRATPQLGSIPRPDDVPLHRAAPRRPHLRQLHAASAGALRSLRSGRHPYHAHDLLDLRRPAQYTVITLSTQ